MGWPDGPEEKDKVDLELKTLRLRIHLKMIELESLQKQYEKLTGRRFSGVMGEVKDVNVQDRG